MKAISKLTCLMFVLCMALSSHLFAQVDDRVPITARHPDAAKLRDLQTDSAYQYGVDAPEPANPLAPFFIWLYTKLMWLLSKLVEFLASESYSNVWQYVILAAFAGLVIYLLLKAEVLGSLFARQAKKSELDYEIMSEDIHEMNFEMGIATAVEQQNYRLAVRLLYLRTLKQLTDAELIQYKIDKTNQQYVHELANSPQQASFAQLTRQFEFVWYGDFPVDAGRFDELRTLFRQFSGSFAIAHR